VPSRLSRLPRRGASPQATTRCDESLRNSGYLLRDARLEVRFGCYTAFLCFGYVGMVKHGRVRAWLSTSAETPSRAAALLSWRRCAGGEMAFQPRQFRGWVEITHFLSFIMGVVYLVLAICSSLPPVVRRSNAR